MQNANYIGYHQGRELTLNVCAFSKCLHGNAPQFLKDLLKPTNQNVLTSEQKRYKLEVPQTKCKTYEDTAFVVGAAKTCTKLSDNIREIENLLQFRKKIKTPVKQPLHIHLC